MNFKSAGKFAVLTVGALSVAAFAAPPGDAAKSARNDAGMASSPSAASAPTSAVKTYCVVDSLTGSHVPRKICKTKAEWSAEGIDVEHPTR